MNEKQIQQIVEMQNDNYANRVGTTFGIFRIDNVQYNWFSHVQEWTISCTKCGHSETVPGSVGRDWSRGKGRSMNKCKFCATAKKEQEKIEKKLAENNWLDGFIGQEVNGWKLTKRNGKTYVAVCNKCGSKRRLSLSKIQSMDFSECKHHVDYSDPGFIGKRFGHLTVLKYVGGDFVVKCDCGFEKNVKCSAIYNGKTTTCGRKECEYHVKNMNYLGKYGELVREAGEETENDVYRMLLARGYDVIKTKTSGDYGVDLICTDKVGKKTAIQVKNNKTTHAKAKVHAVMEVFAGCHFYDCDMCGIISYTGYTENAIKMAKKLGVILYNEKYEPEDISRRMYRRVKYTWVVDGKTEAMIDTFRREGWNQHVDRFVGMTYEEAKRKIDILSEKHNNTMLMREKGVSQQMVKYRMQKMGMTFKEAVSVPKLTPGRPKKQICN